MHYADVLLHIDEPLDERSAERLTGVLEGLPGVAGARHDPHREHLFVVDFDPGEIAPMGVLEAARRAGYHGELVGL
ncbi:MAG: ATP-binding protein [Thiohalorhabdus sp.]|uniref:ATP-binding protein n=1 Tax=Thiohalorhabdus sp. TaxID=3094134 RepID=UPI00397EF22D